MWKVLHTTERILNILFKSFRGTKLLRIVLVLEKYYIASKNRPRARLKIFLQSTIFSVKMFCSVMYISQDCFSQPTSESQEDKITEYTNMKSTKDFLAIHMRPLFLAWKESRLWRLCLTKCMILRAFFNFENLILSDFFRAVRIAEASIYCTRSDSGSH